MLRVLRVKLAAGTLYGAINTMLEKDWIQALPGEKNSRKKEYVITDTGRDVLRMEIARLENITVTEEDVQEKYAELSAMYGMSLQQIHQQLPPARLSHDIKILRARAVVVDSAKRYLC